MKTKEEIADLLVDALMADNGCRFTVNDTQRRLLLRAADLMAEAGCEFTPEEVAAMVAPEDDEFNEKFGHLPGSWLLNAVLEDIFENWVPE